MVKNPPAKAGDSGDGTSIPGTGRPPGGGNGNSLHHSCLGNPWIEESDGLQSTGLQRLGHDWATGYAHNLKIMVKCFID